MSKWILIGLLWLLISVPILSQEEKNGWLVGPDTMERTIPIRAFTQGRPDCRLSKEDFKLFEDKKSRELNAVILKKKKIKDPDPLTRRCFVLIGRIFDFNADIEKGLAYLINDILNPNDRILVLLDNRTMAFENATNKSQVWQSIRQALKEQSQIAQSQLNAELRSIHEPLAEGIGDMLKTTGSIHFHYFMRNLKFLLDRYLNAVLNFKRKHLMPDLGRYCFLGRMIETIDAEKWFVDFYQMPPLPKWEKKYRDILLRKMNELRDSELVDEKNFSETLNDILGNIDDALNLKTYPDAELSQLCYQINASYHAILITPDSQTQPRESDAVKTANSLAAHLKEIAGQTGGVAVRTQNLTQALGVIAAQEDCYYLLGFQSEKRQKPGKIQVIVGKETDTILHLQDLSTDVIDRHLNSEEKTNVRLEDIAFKEKKLAVTISHFAIIGEQTGISARLNVHIWITDSQNHTVFDQSKILTANKDPLTLWLNLNFLGLGTYTVYLEAVDLLSGETDQHFIPVQIS